MKKAARIVASLILAGAMAAPAFAGFEFHGYGRAGVLLNSEGGKASKTGDKDGGVFSPNAPAMPYLYNMGRLGNETDNYMELELTNTFKAGTVGAATKVRLASKDETYSSYPSDTENGVFVRELYTEFYGLPFAPKSTVWAGKRFYGRDDIHINDFYWRIMDGTGAGISNIPMGPGVLDVALICTTTNNTGDWAVIPDKGQVVQKNLDIRYKGIKALGGEFEVQLTPATLTDKKGTDMADSGLQGALVYSRADFFGAVAGSSKVGLQYGTGAGADLGTSAGPYMYKDAENMRLIAWGVADISESLKVSPSLVYSKVDSLYGKDNPKGKDWLALTVRPQYNFTRNLALQVEGAYGTGYTWGGDGSVMKLTVAPTITLDNTSFWTRPQLRAFVTYASWDSKFKAADISGWNPITNDVASKAEESGFTYGVQMETWF